MGNIKSHSAMPADAKPVGEAAAVSAKVASYMPWPESIEFALPDGRQIVMKPPATLSRLANGIMAELQLNDKILLGMEVATVNAFLFIHSIDGDVIAKPHDPITREALEQRIGVRFIDIIVKKYADNFPSDQSDSIGVIKK